MSEDLKELLEAARLVEMTPEEREEQRRSFAYGNSHIENARITRDTVAEEAERLRAENA